MFADFNAFVPCVLEFWIAFFSTLPSPRAAATATISFASSRNRTHRAPSGLRCSRDCPGGSCEQCNTDLKIHACLRSITPGLTFFVLPSITDFSAFVPCVLKFWIVSGSTRPLPRAAATATISFASLRNRTHRAPSGLGRVKDHRDPGGSDNIHGGC